LHNWYQIFGTENTRANLFTKDADLIKENIARLKKIRKLLPPYLVNIVRSDTDNQKEFTNYGQGNRLVAVQAQANEDAALNIGRGLTAAMNHIDEVAFLRFVQISDRKSTRLNSSHVKTSYAVFCLKKKTITYS